MYSGDAPSSNAPGGMSRDDQEHIQASSTVGVETNIQIQATGVVRDQPQSQGDVGHDQGNSLNKSLGVSIYRGGLTQPPTISDLHRRPVSDTGSTATIRLDVPVDVSNGHDYVGITLSGKNFRKFYPNAFYRDENEE